MHADSWCSLAHGLTGRGSEYVLTQIASESLGHTRRQPYGQQRVPAQVEEIVVDADAAGSQRFLPEPHQHPLDVRSRRCRR